MFAELGKGGGISTFPTVDTAAELLAHGDRSWLLTPARARLATAPVTCGNADLQFFISKTHHRHQVGVTEYPTGTATHVTDRYVSLIERAEGATFDQSAFCYASAWLNQCKTLESTPFQRTPSGYSVDTDYLGALPGHSGDVILSFDGNWRSYYHWLIDCVSRLYALRVISDGRMLMPAPREKLSAFHLPSLLQLGISEDDLIFPDVGQQVMRFDSLLYMLWNPTPYAGLGVLRAMSAAYRASVGLDDRLGSRRLYVSRRGRRTVANGDEVIALMMSLGFEVVVPDDLSFQEQVRLFAEAAWIVGPHGAGLTNILFTPPGATVVEFMPDVLCRPHFWGMATSLGHRYGFLTAKCESYFHPLTVDVGQLEKLIGQLADA